MFPSQGDLHISPFTDDALYMEQFSKANFWYDGGGRTLVCLPGQHNCMLSLLFFKML